MKGNDFGGGGDWDSFIPLAFGRETVGQLETVTEGVPEFPQLN
jgi:hypothetical protein